MKRWAFTCVLAVPEVLSIRSGGVIKALVFSKILNISRTDYLIILKR